jgi:hypothetical protein
MKTYGGVEVSIHVFLTLALYACEWSASRPCRFPPKEIVPGSPWIGGWVGQRPSLDATEKRRMLPLAGIEPRPSSPSLLPTELRRLSFSYIILYFKDVMSLHVIRCIYFAYLHAHGSIPFGIVVLKARR